MTRSKETVVFVHGLYMTGFEMSWLRLRVAHQDFDTSQFHYHTVLGSVRSNAARLADYIAGLDVQVAHLVGHSLGGLVILRMFESGVALPPGRVVLLGSPVRGSQAAHTLVAAHLGWALGQSGPQGLAEKYEPHWNGARALGVIAGIGGLGVHPLSRALAKPNDGLVAVEETRLPGAAACIEVKATHMGLLFSACAAQQVVAFLRTAAFLPHNVAA